MRKIVTAFIYLVIVNLAFALTSSLYISQQEFAVQQSLEDYTDTQLGQAADYESKTTTGSQTTLINTINPALDVNPSMADILFRMGKGFTIVGAFADGYDPVNEAESALIIIMQFVQAVVTSILWVRIVLLISSRDTGN